MGLPFLAFLSPSGVLIGSWLNILLFSSEIQLAAYYLLFRDPKPVYKWWIVTIVLVDTVCTVAVCIHAYLYDLEFIAGQVESPVIWPTPIIFITTYLSSFLEQSFFMFRFQKIVQRRFVTASVGALIFAHTVFALGIVIYTATNPPWGGTESGIIADIVMTVSAAVTDLIITVVFVCEVRKIQTSFQSTKGLLHKLMKQAVSCGLTTASWNAIMIMLYFVDTDPMNVFLICLGRVYSLTVLVNILLLKRTMSSSSALRTTTANTNTGLGRSIQVTRTVHTVVHAPDRSTRTLDSRPSSISDLKREQHQPKAELERIQEDSMGVISLDSRISI